MDFSSLVLAACVLGGVICFSLMQWQGYKRSVVLGEFRHPVPSARTRPVCKTTNVTPREDDIDQLLYVGEWLPATDDNECDDDDDTSKQSSQGSIDVKANVIRDPMERLRNASMLVSPKLVLSNGECAICLSTFRTHQLVCKSNHIDCVHTFHKDCMFEWLLSHDTCPICRVCYLDSFC